MRAPLNDLEYEAWFQVYQELQAEGREYYFRSTSGFYRCKEEAEAGVERAVEVWAMYVAKRMMS